MIVTWAVIIAVTLLLEFFTVDFFACCFSLGAAVALILTACNLNIYWQVGIFFLVTIAALCVTRPLVKRFLRKPTVPTNVDQNFGKTAHLLDDVVDGRSSIKINDVIWQVTCDTALKKGDLVIIQSVNGNKMEVKPAEQQDTAKPQKKYSAGG